MTTPLGVILARRARANGGAAAFTVHGSGTMTFGQWHERSVAMASGLLSRGVRPGDRVATLFADGDWLDSCVAYVAVLLCGGVAVPLRRPMQTDGLRELLHRLAVTGLVSDGELDGPGWPCWSASVAELSGGPPPGDATPDDATPDDATPDHATPDHAAPVPSGTDPAAIVLTSGTTRHPKAVVCTHASLTGDWDGVLAPPPDGSVLTSLAIGSNAAQATLCSSVVNGVHVVLLQPFDPGTFRWLVRTHDVTCVSLVPTQARLLLADSGPEAEPAWSGPSRLGRAGSATGSRTTSPPLAATRALASVQVVVSTSAPLDQATVTGLASMFPNAEIHNVYTLTEGGPSLVSVCSPDRPPTLGRVGGGDRLRIVDEAGADVPVGRPGELWIRSAAGPRRHYLEDPGPIESSRTRFLADGWIGTGDVCYQDHEGTVHFAGRADDVIMSGGFNVAAGAVEDVLRRHPAVRDAAVFAVPHPLLGEQIAAAVVLTGPVPLEELRELCAGGLRPHERPHHIGVVPELPTTPTGKVRKRDLPAIFERSMRVPDEGDEVEQMVAEVFERVLGVPSVGPEASFFDLGGHSLQAARVAAELSERRGEPVPARWVLRLPVVRDLAAWLARRR